MMPPRILKLLQFIGFDGNRRKALKYIEAVATGNSIWADFGAVTLLAINLQLEVVAGLGNRPLIEKRNKKFSQNFHQFLGNYDEELCARLLTTFKGKLNDVTLRAFALFKLGIFF